MFDNPFTEWRVREGDFPSGGTQDDKLRFLVRYAILAPSSHNTQPWSFRVSGGQLTLLADRSRRLPVVDPHDRALVISCGAALGNLRVAMRHFGFAGRFQLNLDAANPDLIARVELGDAYVPSTGDHERFLAIQKRRSTRLRFIDEPLPDGLAERLARIGADDGVEVKVITEGGIKTVIASLVARGDQIQFADPLFRAELGAWVRSRRRSSRDGMSGSNFGMPDLLSAAGGLVVRTFDMGKGIAAKDEQIAVKSPALLVIATGSDDPEDWLKAGMAHATALLEVTASGLTSAYLNQPVEVDPLRSKLRSAAAVHGLPQLLLRIGRGPEIAPAVRRHLEDVMR